MTSLIIDDSYSIEHNDCRVPQKEEEAVLVIRQDPRMEDALQQSQRMGDLLLKHEQQETTEISRLAADLIDREYRSVASGSGVLLTFKDELSGCCWRIHQTSWCLTSREDMQGTFEGPSLSQREGGMYPVLQGEC